jgi:hypothetical protein
MCESGPVFDVLQLTEGYPAVLFGIQEKALTLAVQKSDHNKSVARNRCIPVEKTLHHSPVEFCVQVNST